MTRVLLEDPKELGLEAWADVPHLVQEDGAAMGDLEEPLLQGLGACERPFLMTEEFTLQEAVGQRAAIDGDEEAPRSGAIVVDGLGDQLLPGAAFAHQQDCAPGRRDSGHGPVDLDHLWARPHDILEAILLPERLPEHPVVLEETAPLAGAADGEAHFLQVEWLADVIIRPRSDGLDGRLHAAKGRHDDHREVRVTGVKDPEDFDPIQVRKPEVGQDDIEGKRPRPGQGFPAGLGVVNGVPLLLQNLLEEGYGPLIVVNEEDVRFGSHVQPHEGRVMRKVVPCPFLLFTSRDP